MEVVPVVTVNGFAGVVADVLVKLTTLVPTPRVMFCPLLLALVMLTELVPPPVVMLKLPEAIVPSMLVCPGRNASVPERPELFRITVCPPPPVVIEPFPPLTVIVLSPGPIAYVFVPEPA